MLPQGRLRLGFYFSLLCPFPGSPPICLLPPASFPVLTSTWEDGPLGCVFITRCGGDCRRCFAAMFITSFRSLHVRQSCGEWVRRFGLSSSSPTAHLASLAFGPVPRGTQVAALSIAISSLDKFCCFAVSLENHADHVHSPESRRFSLRDSFPLGFLEDRSYDLL